MCLACQTIGIGIAFFLAICSIGCSRQEGYQHRPDELTAEDRREITIVRQSPLGKPPLMREVVDGMVSDDAQLGNCEYWVTKVIDRDHTKSRKGLYPHHYLVACYAEAGEENLKYTWEVENNEFGVVSFGWSLAPDPQE